MILQRNDDNVHAQLVQLRGIICKLISQHKGHLSTSKINYLVSRNRQIPH